MQPDFRFCKSVTIKALASEVWEALTSIPSMRQWMSEDPLLIATSWASGSPITISGDMHGVQFENQGTVLQFEQEQVLSYSHLSSLSQLPDEPGSYSVCTFTLMPAQEGTRLTLTWHNFPTEAIYRHLAFYWNVALEILKKFIEQQ